MNFPNPQALFSVSKVFITLDNTADCLYYEDFPLEVMFIFERKRREISSTWIQPVKTFTYHELRCTCDVYKKQSHDCIVQFRNELYDYNMKKNCWNIHVCVHHDRKLGDVELLDKYSNEAKANRISNMHLKHLGEKIRCVRSRSKFTRLYIDGTLS